MNGLKYNEDCEIVCGIKLSEFIVYLLLFGRVA